MKDGLKDYFHYTKTERNGLFVLLLLLTILLMAPWVYAKLGGTEETDFSPIKEQMALLHTAQKPVAQYEKRIEPKEQTATKTPPKQKKTEKSAFVFDPNTVDKNSLLELGFPAFIADRLIKYRNAGGTFRQKTDLQKIYGLEESLYRRLEPYIEIQKIEEERPKVVQAKEDEKPNVVTTTFSTPKKKTKKLEVPINSATQEDWMALYGIGPKLSARIVKFRDKLGGFNTINQIKEVYGLPDSTFTNIQPHLTFDPMPLVKLAINSSTVEELAAHPYVNWKHAKILVNYRNQHGPYKTGDDFSKIHGISQETITRLLPYLKME